KKKKKQFKSRWETVSRDEEHVYVATTNGMLYSWKISEMKEKGNEFWTQLRKQQADIRNIPTIVGSQCGSIHDGFVDPDTLMTPGEKRPSEMLTSHSNMSAAMLNSGSSPAPRRDQKPSPYLTNNKKRKSVTHGEQKSSSIPALSGNYSASYEEIVIDDIAAEARKGQGLDYKSEDVEDYEDIIEVVDDDYDDNDGHGEVLSDFDDNLLMIRPEDEVTASAMKITSAGVLLCFGYR
ncbi:hypothetical protein RFI_11722, partial [Reticulomyxa filosa]